MLRQVDRLRPVILSSAERRQELGDGNPRRAQLGNTIRGFAAEFGIAVASGLNRSELLLARIAADRDVPERAKELVAILAEEYTELSPSCVASKRTFGLAATELTELAPRRRSSERPNQRLAFGHEDPPLPFERPGFRRRLGQTRKKHGRQAAARRAAPWWRGYLGDPAGQEGARQSLTGLVALIKRKPPRLEAVALANRTRASPGSSWSAVRIQCPNKPYRKRGAASSRPRGSAVPSAVNAAAGTALLRGADTGRRLKTRKET
jgi:transposase